MQKNAISLQTMVNESLSKIFKQDINVVGCGRTDTGVHARKFYAHFDLTKRIKNDSRSTFLHKLNGFLPMDIKIIDIIPVNIDAHARFDAIERTYQYVISLEKDPFLNDFAYFLNCNLNIQLMNQAAQILKEYEDFTSFSKLHTQVKTNICEIKDAQWTQVDHILTFTISADRFLRNMVRAIVGTMINVGKKKSSLQEFRKIIERKDRSQAGYSVPAKGLFLTNVIYPDRIWSNVK
jgi:tRNA pseudouridine38-40 synthase